MSDEPKGYNGYKNYETWAVNLWIGNDERLYRQWQRKAAAAIESAQHPGRSRPLTWSDKEYAKFTLSDDLKDWFENNKPDLGASMWSDLLSAALSEVDWHEVAESLLEGDDYAALSDEVRK